MIDIKLKPCPFCGRNDTLEVESYQSGGVNWFYVTDSECMSQGSVCGTKREAIDTWNRRAPDSESEGGGHSGDKRERLTQAGKEFLSALTDYLTDEFRPIAEAIKTVHELYKKYFVSADLSQSADNTTLQHIKFRDDNRLDKWQLAKLKYPNNKRRMNHAPMIRRRAYLQAEKNIERRRRRREKEGGENAAGRKGKTADRRRHKRHHKRRKKRVNRNTEKSADSQTAGNII